MNRTQSTHAIAGCIGPRASREVMGGKRSLFFLPGRYPRLLFCPVGRSVVHYSSRTLLIKMEK